jgi:amino acid transporter
MANKEFPSEKVTTEKVPDSRNDYDAESVVSNGSPPEGKLVRQLKNRHIAMIR